MIVGRTDRLDQLPDVFGKFATNFGAWTVHQAAPTFAQEIANSSCISKKLQSEFPREENRNGTGSWLTAWLIAAHSPQSGLPVDTDLHLVFEAHVVLDVLTRHANVVGDLVDPVTSLSPS